MKLPIIASVPHAGLRVPPEAEPYCQLSTKEISADGDEGAFEIYSIANSVTRFVTTDVARAIVDLNRAEDDRSPDGVVKTHTCWNSLVYREFPPPAVVEQLLERYYRGYHQGLSLAAEKKLLFGVDCHTMAAVGPPIGPMAGEERPLVCLGDVNGQTLPNGWMERLQECFAQAFQCAVAVNEPFAGGFITRTHGSEMPWVQLELSRASFLPDRAKRNGVIEALTEFCRWARSLPG